MRSRTRTINKPLFEGFMQGAGSWRWVVTMQIASSGYCASIHVIARRDDELGGIVGTASGVVPPFCDVHEALEIIATEAMMAAVRPPLFGDPEPTIVDVSTQLT